MRELHMSRTADEDFTRLRQCLRDLEVAVLKRDGERLFEIIEELERLMPFLEVDDINIEDALPYLGMKATCKEIKTRLDSLSRQGEHLIELLKQVSDEKTSYDKRIDEVRVLQGIDVSG